MSKLRAEQLQKRYRGRTVVHDVSLSVESGEVVGLLGPNGAGKTTSFYMIIGLVPANGGAVYLDDKDMRHWPIHRRARAGLGYLPQEASIFRRMTVAENVLSILELHEPNEKKRMARLETLLGELHVTHLRDQMPQSLSGGERRRVEIVRALASNPKFILLDEPFNGVDPIAVADVQRMIGFLKDRGIGVLITDHKVRETLDICDRAYIIAEGKVLADGHPEQLVANEAVRKVYLGESFTL
ncbi:MULTISPECIES: LPS export ABC transporter ATP-binding protein [Leeia]|uniref:Lipopolysaccharide export system ATP-binding protein LptB n=1 Tax=Leeia aquatica TaxID=2725557 RepID=A0A847SI61_9NEIS|nr:LPS export ABC transporter ATP-binding protein [Leeia aquatica]NLR76849.1 LPS export ABC transporter ATP-binding protein [Leeia aquatica]